MIPFFIHSLAPRVLAYLSTVRTRHCCHVSVLQYDRILFPKTSVPPPSRRGAPPRAATTNATPLCFARFPPPPPHFFSFCSLQTSPFSSTLLYPILFATMFFGGDPFEHFSGMHGGGPGGPGSMRGPPKDVDTTKLYETLGVSSTHNRPSNADAGRCTSAFARPAEVQNDHPAARGEACWQIMAVT